jgi:uncharacterized protein
MELTLDGPGDYLSIRSVSAAGIRIADRTYPGPLIISRSQLLTDWPASHPGAFSETLFEPVFDLAPEIVLVGTGSVQVFPAPELLMCFYRRGIGVEIMTTQAACRTFNVLVSERRNVVAALLSPSVAPEPPTQGDQSRNGSST